MHELIGITIGLYILVSAIFLVLVVMPMLCVKGFMFYFGKRARIPGPK